MVTIALHTSDKAQGALQHRRRGAPPPPDGDIPVLCSVRGVIAVLGWGLDLLLTDRILNVPLSLNNV